MAIGTPTLRGTAVATAASTTIIVTLTSGVPVGERVFAVAGGRGSGAQPASAVDSKGNTYGLDRTHNQADGNNTIGILSAPVTVALVTGDTVTVTFAGTVGPSIEAFVFSCSGLQASALDQVASASNDLALSSAFSSGFASSTTVADELLIGAAVFGGASVSLTPGAGFTQLLAELSSSGAASGDRPIWGEYRIVSATGSYQANGTDASTGNAGTLLATYKGQSSDVTPPTVPTGLAVTGVLTPTGGGLSCNPSTDAVGVVAYKWYRGGVLFRTTPGPFALITGLAPATTYSFTVSAIDAAGNESAQSSAVSVTTFPARRLAGTVDPRPLAGVYRGAGSGGRDAVREWERWLGRPVKRALDFLPTDTWAEESPFNAYWNGRDSPFAANGGERITMGVTMVPDTNTGGATNPGPSPPTLAEAALGTYNVHYSKIVDFLAAHDLYNVTMRPGNEHNGLWSLPWQPSTGGGTAADFAEAYRQLVTTMRARATAIGFAQTWKFEYSWATGDNGGALQMDGVNYPGDSYWDVLSLNCYDEAYNGDDAEARFAALLVSTPTTGGPGLNYARDFAAAKGKVLAFGELGPAWHPSATNFATADAPRFLEYVFEWISDGDNRVSYWNWWDGSATWVYRLLQRDPAAASKALPRLQRTYHRLVSARPLGAPLMTANRSRTYVR